VIPIALSPAASGGAPLLSSVRNRNAIVPQFSTLFQKAQANAPHDTPEIPELKSLVRKAAAKLSTDLRSPKPGSQQAVPVPFVPGQQLKPIPPRFSFTPGAGSQQAPDNNAPVDAATETSDPGGSNDAAAQQAVALPTIAFSINLEKFGTSDQKADALGRQNTDATQRGQLSTSTAAAAQSDESSSSHSGSHQPGAEEREPVEAKMVSAGSIKQDVAPAAPSEIPALPISANAAIYTTTSAEPRQAHVNAAADAQTVTSTEPPATPAPVSPKHIELTVSNDAGHPVDIRISQRGADVQVTVRTLDGNLAQSLKHHLPELSENLSHNGPREEFFHSARSQSSETPNGRGQQQGQHHPEDRNRPPAKSRVKDQESGSFTEMIHREKRNN
jgi:hypothetical protein